MRIGIFENIMTPGGHEVDFDRILVEELRKLGHEVLFYVPEGFKFSMDYHVTVRELPGKVVSYTDVKNIWKMFRALKREMHRMRWYKELYRAAKTGEVDAIIVPTSTYRYLRAVSSSVLRKSPVPVVFILHGINPREAADFLKMAKKIEKYPIIKPTVISFADHIFGLQTKNLHTIYPPTYIPRDIDWVPGTPRSSVDNTLILGFFGQFRREKRLEDFIKVYLKGNYTRPVKLLVQGATMHPEDEMAFKDIIARYQGQKGITFLHKGLIGKEWQEAIKNVDALLLPYSAPRYRYHWGGMFFTAIGFQKPLITSDDMNPEVFERFDVGERFESGKLEDLKLVLEDFINNYDEREPHYRAALKAAAEEYAPEAFAKRLLAIITEGDVPQ